MVQKSDYFSIQALIIFVGILLSINSRSYAESNPEVHISLGKIKGSMMKTRLEKDIYAFRGIRYAKPPTGMRRFKVWKFIV